jgi:hypothetical protein
MKYTLLGLSVAIAALFPASAKADCKVQGPSPMYLGKNENYSLLITMGPSELCAIFFNALASDVQFNSAEVIAPPAAGKLTSAGRFDFAYAAPKTGHDAFTIKLCGNDTAGTGCNKLDYSVQVQ